MGKENEARVREALVRFIGNKGWKLLSECHMGFMVFTTDSCLVLAGVEWTDEPKEPIPEFTCSRDVFEEALVSWITHNPETIEGGIRMDGFECKVCSNTRMLIRHHIAIYGGEAEYEWEGEIDAED